MLYSEASYFDGYHFQHIAAWLENQRLDRILKKARDRRINRKVSYNV